ncbi:hypothetical protein OSJ57_24360 [Sphingomonas sp. HH69]
MIYTERRCGRLATFAVRAPVGRLGIGAVLQRCWKVASSALPLARSLARGSGNGTLTATTAYSYDDIGNRTYVDGPLSGTGDTTRTIYDAARQVVGVIGPDPDNSGSLKNSALRISYNLRGQQQKVERGTAEGQSDSAWAAFTAAERIDISFDAANRKNMEALRTGSASATTTHTVTQYSYFANNLSVSARWIKKEPNILTFQPW